MGPVGRSLPGRPGGDQPAQVRTPPQGPHGRAHPRTAARPAGPGRALSTTGARRPRTLLAGRPPEPARGHLHRRRPDPDPLGRHTTTSEKVWADDPATGKRRDLAPRRGSRVLGLGGGRGPPAHRRPHRGTAGDQPPQPDPVPAAHHRRARPAAADRPVQDRCRATPRRQPRAGRRPVRDHPPGPRPLGAVPLVPAYDRHECVWLPPSPFLFQRRSATENRRSATAPPQPAQRRARRTPASSIPPTASRCTTPRTTSAGSSSPTRS